MHSNSNIQPVWNFSAGPSMLPMPVMKKLQKELCNYDGSGMSIMEISHRSALFNKVHNAALKNFRTLLNISDEYSVIFSQGGAIGQNSFVPMNLLGKNSQASYAITGMWSQKSANEAKKYTNNLHIAYLSNNFNTMQEMHMWQIDRECAYLHICTNETINGLEFIPQKIDGVTMVADMSSHILSRKIDISNFGVIYGGAQKNMAPSGLTFVIVKNDLLDQAMEICPTSMHWRTLMENNSLYNTPNTFSIYVAGLVFEWLLENGGIENIEIINKEKSSLFYNYIDSSNFYSNYVDNKYRSRMNISFFLNNEELNDKFLQQAEQAKLFGLKGHKSIGGMRASIYNAMPLEGVEVLIDFMQKFANAH